MNLHEQLQMYGAAGLSTPDLLAFTLTYKIEPRMQARLANLLLQYSPRRLRQASRAELEAAGLTRAQAERLVVIGELTRRLARLEAEPLLQIKAPSDAVRLLLPYMEDQIQETFRVLVLNTKNYVVENLELYRGTVNSSVVQVAEILKPAVVRNCPAILVAHNHPSGDPKPSPEDLTMTELLIQAGKLLEIDVTDHLILGHSGNYTSLRTTMRW